MIENGLVVGGVGRTCFCLTDKAEEMADAFWINLPECCALEEWFDAVSLADDELLDGSRRRLNVGFRYHVRLHFPYLNAADYLTVMRMVAFGNHQPFFFRPHRDSSISHRVATVDGGHFRYISGKLRGYEGELELVGLDLLASPPTTGLDQISHFASASATYKAADLGIQHYGFDAFPGDFNAYRTGEQPQGWTLAGGGSGSVVRSSSGKAYQMQDGTGLTESFCGVDYSDFIVHANLCGLSGIAGLTFRRAGIGNCYRLRLDYASDTICVVRLDASVEQVLASYPQQGLLLNHLLSVRLTCIGSSLAVAIRRDHMQVWDYAPCGDVVEDSTFSSGRLGVFVQNGSALCQQIRMRMMDGSMNYYREGEIETLAHFSA